MFNTTATTVGGILLWYSIKYFLLYEYVNNDRTLLYKHCCLVGPNLIAIMSAIVLGLVLYGRRDCTPGVRTAAMGVLIVNSFAFALDSLSVGSVSFRRWGRDPALCDDCDRIAGNSDRTKVRALDMPAAHVAALASYMFLSAAGARGFPDTPCASISTIAPTMLMAALVVIAGLRVRACDRCQDYTATP